MTSTVKNVQISQNPSPRKNKKKNYLTIFMQLFSSKVEVKSVTISWAKISTACFSSWCFLTKSSLARTAAPAPSDVGLIEMQQTTSLHLSGSFLWVWHDHPQMKLKRLVCRFTSCRLESGEALTNTAAEWGSQTPSWTWPPAPDCTHPGTVSTCTGSHMFTQQVHVWRKRGDSKQELTGCWWNVCGFSKRFWQSVLVLCLNRNSAKAKTNIIAPSYCAALGSNNCN